MKLFSVLFTFAFFTVALVHAEDGPKHSLNRMHARRTADAGARDDGGAGGGEDGGGKLSCKRTEYGNIIVCPVNDKKYTFAGVRDNQLIVGPPDAELETGTTGSIFTCASSYMQTTQDTHSGFFKVGGRCITVHPDELTVTLEECATADGPDVASQFFGLAHDTGGPYAKFLGGPPGSELDIGFKIDDSDPQGLIVAVKGGGEVIITVDN